MADADESIRTTAYVFLVCFYASVAYLGESATFSSFVVAVGTCATVAALQALTAQRLRTFQRRRLQKAARTPEEIVSLVKGLAARGPTHVVELARDRASEDGIRVAALGWLVRESAEHVPPVLEALLSDPSDPVRAAAVSALARDGGEADVARLVAILGDAGPDCRVAIVRALMRAHASSQEALLVRLLQDPEERVRDAAANALGQLGSAVSVKALHETAGSAAEIAIRRIQSRVAGGRGDLALAERDEAGELSIAESGGDLSLVRRGRKDPAGSS